MATDRYMTTESTSKVHDHWPVKGTEKTPHQLCQIVCPCHVLVILITFTCFMTVPIPYSTQKGLCFDLILHTCRLDVIGSFIEASVTSLHVGTSLGVHEISLSQPANQLHTV